MILRNRKKMPMRKKNEKTTATTNSNSQQKRLNRGSLYKAQKDIVVS